MEKSSPIINKENQAYSEKSLELYKEHIRILRTKLEKDQSSFISPILCNNEITFYLPKKGKYIYYLSDRYFIKRSLITKKVEIKHELPPELFPNQIKSITFNCRKDKMLILTTRKRAPYLDIFLYDIKTGKVRKIFLYEGKEVSLSLSKNQGFKDHFIYQSKKMGETTLKSYDLRSNSKHHLFCLDPNKESLRTFIPCVIRKLGLVFVMSFNSQENYFMMNIYNYSRRKLVNSFRVDHQINWYISQHNKLTIMYYDQFCVVFSINVLLFFIDLKRKSCKVFNYFDRPFAGMVKKISEDEKPPKLENFEVVEYEGFFIAVANDDFVFTYKSQLRRLPNGDILYLSTSDIVNMKNGVEITIRNAKEQAPLLTYYCLGVNPYEFETVKMGDREILLSVKHREFNRNLVLEVFKFNIITRQRYCWRKNLGATRGTRYNFLTFSQPNHHNIVIFYIVNGISLNFRIFNCLDNTFSDSQKLIDDSGPMDILKLDDDLNFIFNFRFTGIMTGNFNNKESFRVIPGTEHIFRTHMVQYGGQKYFYHLVDDFRRTRLERLNYSHNPPTKDILFPDDRDFIDMDYFSEQLMLSKRDDILFFYDCERREKRSFRVPGIRKIDNILHFKKEGRKILVGLTDETFHNIYDIYIENDEISKITCDKVKYNSDKCFIYSSGSKIYQISDDHFYDMESGQFLNPDYKGILTELFERKVEDKEDLRGILETVAHLGYKFSKYFGKNSIFEQIFRYFGDIELLDMYRINFDFS